jgi:ketosteroid isomerase-like protein
MASILSMDKTVGRFYTAIKSGDIELLKTLITNDMKLYWQGPSDIPWAGTWKGLEKVLAFFSILAKHVEVVSIKPLTKLSGEDTQIIFIKGQWRVGKDKKTVSAIAANWFTFRENKISNYTVINDTGNFLNALNVPSL